MYIEKGKPQPPMMEKEDPVGIVLESFIENDRNLQETQGETTEQVAQISQETQTALTKLTAFETRVKNKLKTHVDKKGAVHGETKITVGLGNKDNFPMGTMEEHKAGLRDDVYAHPAGLKVLVESRVQVDPRSYIPARTLPLASGGLLGDIPQWHYDMEVGELVQSPTDPKEFLGDTPWEFSTSSGVMVYPTMNGSPVHGRYTQVQTGTLPMVQGPWGGTKIRVYNKTLDARRSRPSFIRGWNSGAVMGDTVRVSNELFDKKTIHYLEGTSRFIRSFNKNSLPFDIYKGGAGGLYRGIHEYSEGFKYNFATKIVNWAYPGSPDPTDIYLQLDQGVLTINESDYQCADTPSLPAERAATGKADQTTFNITVPVHGKIKVLTNGSIAVKLKDLVATPAGIETALYANCNIKASESIAFAWQNRMRHQGVFKLAIGWWNKDKSKYWHAWLPFNVGYVHNEVTKTTTLTVTTSTAWDAAKQVMNANYDLTGTGLFKSYSSNIKEDPAHPLALGGTFENQGGHLKTFTLYNRQYVGYYEHTVKDNAGFIELGTNPFPVPTKYSYLAQSTINSDGMYGDHLRHIPIWNHEIGQAMSYLTRVRDWRNRYRWALVKVDSTLEVSQNRRFGNFMGNAPQELFWLSDTFQVPNSFLIENDDLASAMNINCMVFNSKNRYQGYSTYTFDPANLEEPVVYSDPVTIHSDINAWISENAGGWQKNDKLYFYFKGHLFWFNQCVSADEYPVDGQDCYYGVIKDCYIHVDLNGEKTIRPRTTIAESVVVNSMNVNKKATLQVDHGTILGYDPLGARDIYAMKTYHQGTDIRYDVMIPVAPFNNFYIEMKLGINPDTKDAKIRPKPEAVDPIFPYVENVGYQIDYDKEILYGTKIPHRLHINFQSPVMLKKGMWSFRKTPNDYGFFTRRHGFVTVTGGVMGTFPGATVYPVGSVLTIGGKNTVVKKPLNFEVTKFDPNEELFVRIEAGNPILYGNTTNPNGYEIEPHNGASPAGFVAGGEFSYFDRDGWKNSLLPVIEGTRMNWFGYGRSFPVFLGKTGSPDPVNRFFLAEAYTTLTWDTAQGRTVPTISKRNTSLTIDGETFYMNGAQSFVIPAKFTGVKTITIARLQTLKWAAGMTALTAIGGDVVKLDFAGSSQFTISAALPKRVTSLANTFLGATGATYPGLENWNVAHVLDFNHCFSGTTNFNQALPNWRLTEARNMEGMFRGALKYNQPMVGWNPYNVTTAAYMFRGANAFNQVLTWNMGHVRTIRGMFRDTAVFNQSVTGLQIPLCTDLHELFMGSLLYNTSLNGWKLDSVQHLDDMFNAAMGFNQPIDLTLPQCVSVIQMFQSNSVFNSSLNLVMPICRDYTRMFADNTKFNQPLPAWNFPPRTDLTEMFLRNTAFNQTLSHWMMERVVDIKAMFRYSTVYNQPITGWKLLSLMNASYLFANTNFDSPLEGWLWPLETTGVLYITGLFYACPEFNQDITYWNTDNWTHCSGMFYATKKFNQPIGVWKMGNVKTLPNFFFGATAFDQDISNWDVSQVQDLSQFARDAGKFKSDVSRWKVGNCLNFAHTFRGNPEFNSELGDWDMGKATTIEDMLNGCLIFNRNINNWNVSNVTKFNGFLIDCAVYNQPMDKWDVRNGIEFGSLFSRALKFNQPLNTWVMANAQRTFHMFAGAVEFNSPVPASIGKPVATNNMFWGAVAFNQPIGHFDLSESIPTGYFLDGCNNFNQDVSNLNVGNASDLSGFFRDCYAFNGDVSKWRPVNCKKFSNTFRNCREFNSNLNDWPVGNANDMTAMLAGCGKYNQPMDKWDVSNVILFESFLYQCTLFNQPIGMWNVSNATTFFSFFRECSNFNQPLNGWVMTKALNLARMFQACGKYNSAAPGNIGNPTNILSLFSGCNAFNQPVGHFSLVNVVASCEQVFGDCWEFNQDISSWNTGKVPSMYAMFRNAKKFNRDLSMWPVTKVTNHGEFDSGATAWVLPRPNFIN